MLFIIKGYVEKHHYMQDDHEREDFMYPVEGVDEEDARDILEKHYTQQDSSYCVHHIVRIEEVFPTLSRT
jgi:hypothetical protein